ncbi:MAG: carbohydrate kinase family protein [Candidatus Veblenbacteria bacterium]|nr:carbohydrate kinase family protein [Candidatus Veblenbacteria bacterium]
MEQRVCVIGGATWDAFFTTAQADLVKASAGRGQPALAFPYGGKVDAQEVLYGFGGGAANVAVGLTHLGVRADVLTRVGRDWRGSEVAKNFRHVGVGTRLLQYDRSTKTALAFIVTAGRGHDHVAFVARGATVNLHVPPRLPGRYQWCYVSALATPDWSVKLRRLFGNFTRQGGSIFWNPGAGQLAEPKKLAALLRYVTVLDLNSDEARLLLRRLKRGSFRNVPAMLKALKALGPKLVLVTCGHEGAYLYDGTHCMYHEVYQVKPVNTTGAGDAFGSGWLAGYLASGMNLNVAMQWGMLNSNSVITQVGAQRGLLTMSTLAKFRAFYDRA